MQLAEEELTWSAVNIVTHKSLIAEYQKVKKYGACRWLGLTVSCLSFSRKRFMRLWKPGSWQPSGGVWKRINCLDSSQVLALWSTVWHANLWIWHPLNVTGLCELWTSQVVFIAKNPRNQTLDRLTDWHWLYSFEHYNTTPKIDPNGGNKRIQGSCEKSSHFNSLSSFFFIYGQYFACYWKVC
jgi:hypothetical protein